MERTDPGVRANEATTLVREPQGAPTPQVVPRRVGTCLVAGDPISRAALAAQLGAHDELTLVDEPDQAGVGVVVLDEIDEKGARQIRAVLRDGCPQVVVVSTALDNDAVLRAVEAGACAILLRREASPERLVAVVVAAEEGHGALPPDLLGSLLSQEGTFPGHVAPPRGLLVNGFTEREIEVLRLVAEGYDTAEVADELAYSERTVKNVLHDVTSRFNLRNRCHAVAYALRAGVI